MPQKLFSRTGKPLVTRVILLCRTEEGQDPAGKGRLLAKQPCKRVFVCEKPLCIVGVHLIHENKRASLPDLGISLGDPLLFSLRKVSHLTFQDQPAVRRPIDRVRQLVHKQSLGASLPLGVHNDLIRAGIVEAIGIYKLLRVFIPTECHLVKHHADARMRGYSCVHQGILLGHTVCQRLPQGHTNGTLPGRVQRLIVRDLIPRQHKNVLVRIFFCRRVAFWSFFLALCVTFEGVSLVLRYIRFVIRSLFLPLHLLGIFCKSLLLRSLLRLVQEAIGDIFQKTFVRGVDFFKDFCYTNIDRARVLGNAVFGIPLLPDLCHFYFPRGCFLGRSWYNVIGNSIQTQLAFRRLVRGLYIERGRNVLFFSFV